MRAADRDIKGYMSRHQGGNYLKSQESKKKKAIEIDV